MSGVLTKPDRIPAGEEAMWINKIQSGEANGGIEYFFVKNPDSQDIKNGITYEQARENETEFFLNRTPWSSLELPWQRRLGTDKLTKRLGQVLCSLTSFSLCLRHVTEACWGLRPQTPTHHTNLNSIPTAIQIVSTSISTDILIYFSNTLYNVFCLCLYLFIISDHLDIIPRSHP